MYLVTYCAPGLYPYPKLSSKEKEKKNTLVQENMVT